MLFGHEMGSLLCEWRTLEAEIQGAARTLLKDRTAKVCSVCDGSSPGRPTRLAGWFATYDIACPVCEVYQPLWKKVKAATHILRLEPSLKTQKQVEAAANNPPAPDKLAYVMNTLKGDLEGPA